MQPTHRCFPVRLSANQAINYPDNENNQHFIEKLNYKRQFSSNSYADFALFRTSVYDHFGFRGAAASPTSERRVQPLANTGIEVDYQNQISNQNLIAIGGTGKFSKTDFSIRRPNARAAGRAESNSAYIGYSTGPWRRRCERTAQLPTASARRFR